MKKYYFFILFSLSVSLLTAQLSPQSKKITEKFFSEFEELESLTPALKKKKGYTNYKELIEFLNNISSNHQDKVTLNYIDPICENTIKLCRFFLFFSCFFCFTFV